MNELLRPGERLCCHCCGKLVESHLTTETDFMASTCYPFDDNVPSHTHQESCIAIDYEGREIQSYSERKRNAGKERTVKKALRWPPKDRSDLLCQPVQDWLNEADISQEAYDIILVLLGRINYLEQEVYDQHLRITALERIFERSTLPNALRESKEMVEQNALRCGPMEVRYTKKGTNQ